MLLKEILDGWGNLVKQKFGLVDAQTEEIAKLRLLVCDTCDLRLGQICNPAKTGLDVLTNETKSGCGCVIPAKVLSLDSSCPLNKW